MGTLKAFTPLRFVKKQIPPGENDIFSKSDTPFLGLKCVCLAFWLKVAT